LNTLIPSSLSKANQLNRHGFDESEIDVEENSLAPNATYVLAVVDPQRTGGVWSLRRVCDGATTRRGNARKFTDMIEPEGSISP